MALVRSPKQLNSGFTLVELVLTIVIIGIAGLGISTALSFGLQHQSDGLEFARSTTLAQAYIEEIMAKRYDETTPLGGVPPCSAATIACSNAINFDDGESRAQFDDVDDYHNLVEQPPLNVDGSVRTAFARYTVAVQVNYASSAQVTALGLNDATDAKVISVTVTPPAASPTTYSVVRTNF